MLFACLGLLALPCLSNTPDTLGPAGDGLPSVMVVSPTPASQGSGDGTRTRTADCSTDARSGRRGHRILLAANT